MTLEIKILVTAYYLPLLSFHTKVLCWEKNRAKNFRQCLDLRGAGDNCQQGANAFSLTFQRKGNLVS